MTTNHGDQRVNWGILGTGMIAKILAKAIGQSQTARLLAVGSRTQAGADAFGNEFNVERRYDSYEKLLADPDVKVVYISLPNHLHCLWTVRCAEAGKHILCEKPLATNYPEAMLMIEAARQHNVFFMEAFMYRCHPATARLAEMIRQGAVGQVRQVQVSFAYNMGPKLDNIRLRNDAAGGSIVDVGCYCLSMTRLVAGAAVGRAVSEPIDLSATANIGDKSQVDEWSAAVAKFEGGITATMACGSQVGMDNVLKVFGSEGHIVVPKPWFPGREPGEVATVQLHKPGQEVLETAVPCDVPLYANEVDVVGRCIDAGQVQAPAPCMTWEDSLAQQKALDRWRKGVGLMYEREKPDAEALRTPLTGHAPGPRKDHVMPLLHLAGLDQPVSQVVMGSMVFSIRDMPLTCALLDYFVEAGGNCIDTAYVYGGGLSEKAVGQWMKLRGNRRQIVLVGKGAHTPHCHPDGINQHLRESLDRLATDYFDIYFLHRDNTALPVKELLDCLLEHHRAGRVKLIGGSNWTLPRLEEADAYLRQKGLPGFLASNNLALARWNEPMWAGCVSVSDPTGLAWQKKHRMPLFAWSSQASGLFTGRYKPADRAVLGDKHDVVRTWFNDENFARLARAEKLAKQKGCTAIQIALAYVLCQPFPAFALAGPQTIEETRTTLAGVTVKLTPQELKWLALGEQ